MSRIADHAHVIHLELSAFLVIVWHTYRNKSMLEFSALARAIFAEATAYFLAMMVLQVYVQLSLHFMKVPSSSPPWFLVRFAIADFKTPGHRPTTFVSVSTPSTRTIRVRG